MGIDGPSPREDEMPRDRFRSLVCPEMLVAVVLWSMCGRSKLPRLVIADIELLICDGEHCEGFPMGTICGRVTERWVRAVRRYLGHDLGVR